ncbi:MAG TPA: transcriptional regulator [Ruminococcaceae bacterium]|nr:transcriptional regulator [Oscillospiraceae bacterium]
MVKVGETMGMSTKVKMLLASRDMTVKDLATKLGTTSQNMTAKIRRDNLSENDLVSIAKACNASFEGIFKLNDTGKEV